MRGENRSYKEEAEDKIEPRKKRQRLQLRTIKNMEMVSKVDTLDKKKDKKVMKKLLTEYGRRVIINLPAGANCAH